MKTQKTNPLTRLMHTLFLKLTQNAGYYNIRYYRKMHDNRHRQILN
jgi:hypothetical protein